MFRETWYRTEDSIFGPGRFWYDPHRPCPGQRQEFHPRSTFLLDLGPGILLANPGGGFGALKVESRCQSYRSIWPSSPWTLPNLRGSWHAGPVSSRCESNLRAITFAATFDLLYSMCTSWSHCQTAGLSSRSWSSRPRCWCISAPGGFGSLFMFESKLFGGCWALAECQGPYRFSISWSWDLQGSWNLQQGSRSLWIIICSSAFLRWTDDHTFGRCMLLWRRWVCWLPSRGLRRSNDQEPKGQHTLSTCKGRTCVEDHWQISDIFSLTTHIVT